MDTLIMILSGVTLVMDGVTLVMDGDTLVMDGDTLVMDGDTQGMVTLITDIMIATEKEIAMLQTPEGLPAIIQEEHKIYRIQIALQQPEEVRPLKIQIPEDHLLQQIEVGQIQLEIATIELHQDPLSKEVLLREDHLQWDEETWPIIFYQIIRQHMCVKLQTQEAQIQAPLQDLSTEIPIRPPILKRIQVVLNHITDLLLPIQVTQTEVQLILTTEVLPEAVLLQEVIAQQLEAVQAHVRLVQLR